MITSWHTIQNDTTYTDLRFAKISNSEGVKPEAYLDSKNIPSIGIGFNLSPGSVRDLVFLEMGLNANSGDLSAEAQIAEQHYIDLLVKEIGRTFTKGEKIQGKDLRSALDKVMDDRAKDPVFAQVARITNRHAFEMSPDEMKVVFDQVVATRETAVDDWLPAFLSPTSV